MENTGKTFQDKLGDFQTLLTKMPLQVICALVLPELEIEWSDILQTVTKAHLEMTSGSVAKILRRYVAKAVDEVEVDDIMRTLKLKTVAVSTTRTWHTLRLEGASDFNETTNTMSELVPTRILYAARRLSRAPNSKPMVKSTKLGDFLFLSVEMVSASKESVPLYVAITSEAPVIFASSESSKLLNAVVEGLGFQSFTAVKLHGPDIVSLLRIYTRNWLEDLQEKPDYDPRPIVTNSGIDYTTKAYDENYVDTMLGPNPPLLRSLVMKSSKPDPNCDVLRDMSVTIELKSDDVAKTLKCWVANKILGPTSVVFDMFHDIQSNEIDFCDD